MKTLIPISRSGENPQISTGFANAHLVCLFDTESNHMEWLPIDAVLPNPNNMGLYFRQKQVNNIITRYMSPLAINMLNELGIKVLRASTGNLNENISLFLESKLPHFSFQSIDNPTSCHGGCSACNTTC
jgi:predicted Fe-Mo cluster-binding NifX family protein